MRGRLAILMLVLCTGCPLLPTGAPPPESPELIDLDRRHQAILKNLGPYGDGGREVLAVAHRVLRQGRAEGRWELVGLEDLWAHAIKEGAILFNKPERRWGLTRAGDTDDTFGQSTVGPWQLTINTIRNVYGPRHGVQPEWTAWQTYVYCRDHPDVQARMAADYIQESYAKYGRRGPYAIQRYYSLRAFVRGHIGLGSWDRSVTATAPGGDWNLIPPEAKAATGFYAKQLLLGTRANPHGLLYWLWVTGDREAIDELLRTWRDQTVMEWDESRNRPILTDTPGDFALRPDDLKYLRADQRCFAEVSAAIEAALSEKQPPVGTSADSASFDVPEATE